MACPRAKRGESIELIAPNAYLLLISGSALCVLEQGKVIQLPDVGDEHASRYKSANS